MRSHLFTATTIPFSGLVSYSRYLLILLRKAFCCVDHQNTYVASLDGCDGSDDAVALYVLIYLAFSPDTGRIYEYIFFSVFFEGSVYRVPGGSGYGRHYHAPLA